MMVKRFTTLALLVIVTASMGCAKLTTTHKWMAVGAGAGAAIGGIWGAEGSGLLNAGEGAAIGAVTGATAGATLTLAREQVLDFADRSTETTEDNRNVAIATGTGAWRSCSAVRRISARLRSGHVPSFWSR
jgi:uncharacterized membrane protein